MNPNENATLLLVGHGRRANSGTRAVARTTRSIAIPYASDRYVAVTLEVTPGAGHTPACDCIAIRCAGIRHSARSGRAKFDIPGLHPSPDWTHVAFWSELVKSAENSDLYYVLGGTGAQDFVLIAPARSDRDMGTAAAGCVRFRIEPAACTIGLSHCGISRWLVRT